MGQIAETTTDKIQRATNNSKFDIAVKFVTYSFPFVLVWATWATMQLYSVQSDVRLNTATKVSSEQFRTILKEELKSFKDDLQSKLADIEIRLRALELNSFRTP